MTRILMVASEANPFAKTGGLADVVGSLPIALAAKGQEVAVAMPFYPGAAAGAPKAESVYRNLRIWLGRDAYDVNIRMLKHDGVTFYFVECPPLFGRPELYGAGGEDYPDNHIRYGVFCRAVLGIIRHLYRPHIIHCHDWQSALVPVFLKTQFAGDPTFYGIKVLFTIHNLGYQGLFDPTALGQLGLDASLFTPAALEFFGKINLLKGALVFSDALSTVSRGYAREVQTKEYGWGLDGLLRERASVLTGIVNGVDYGEWSPDRDKHICCSYSAADTAGKRKCKLDLLKTFGLTVDDLDRPVLGIVSRFAGQKGFDLIEEISADLLLEDIYLTVIGSGEPQYEQMFLDLAKAGAGRIGVRVAYDNEIAHKIEAGADMFLMPSRYEPCGLNQIYSLRYGTVPIVRATGGLDDTIDEETGFKFLEYSGAALLRTIRDALAAYKDKARWQRLMITGMGRDFSWDASASEYIALYKRLTE
ncbi:MAG TPA: glycogen synthase GlgA [Bryobacteraceae bacterium]|nr:glycogen synthase GlgA [Bryobacteraceae bacterium]